MITTKIDINKNSLSGTKASLTYNRRALWHIAKDKAMKKVAEYKKEFEDSVDDLVELISPNTENVDAVKSTMTLQEGLARPVVDPYNPKIHKTSVVDIKKRVAAQKILKKGKVDNSNLERYIQKVRVYTLKDNEGVVIAKKLEHRPWQKIIQPFGE